MHCQIWMLWLRGGEWQGDAGSGLTCRSVSDGADRFSSWMRERRSITSIYCSYSLTITAYTASCVAGCCYGSWSSLLPEEMTISSFAEVSIADEDDDPGVRGRCYHEPPEAVPEPTSPGAGAHDLPIAGVVDEEQR